jgi:uncharacterized protein YecT (DUF1311 family)
MKALAIIPLLWIVSSPVSAQEIKCDPAGTQAEMNACAAENAEAADDELNAAYRAVIACGKNDPTFIGNLKAAQRLWIQFRDAELQARFPVPEGENERVLYGSMYPMELLGEKEKLARERTRQLHAFIDDPVYGIGCRSADNPDQKNEQENAENK